MSLHILPGKYAYVSKLEDDDNTEYINWILKYDLTSNRVTYADQFSRGIHTSYRIAFDELVGYQRSEKWRVIHRRPHPTIRVTEADN